MCAIVSILNSGHSFEYGFKLKFGKENSEALFKYVGEHYFVTKGFGNRQIKQLKDAIADKFTNKFNR